MYMYISEHKSFHFYFTLFSYLTLGTTNLCVCALFLYTQAQCYASSLRPGEKIPIKLF